MSYYDTPVAPMAEAISVIAGTPPPFWLEGVYKFNDITDEHVQEALQSWCSEHARPVWATGLSMIEAAELIVEMAIENANIDSGA